MTTILIKQIQDKKRNKIKTYIDGIEVHINFGTQMLYYIRRLGRKILAKIFYKINRKECDVIFKYINLNQNDDVLDIGFGLSCNYFSEKLSKQNMNSPYSHRFSSLKILKNGRLKFILQGEKISTFGDNNFTKIYTINTMFFNNDCDVFFLDIKRILKPNGIFINIIVINKYLNKIFYKKYGYKELSIEKIKEITEKHMRIKKIIEIRKNKSYCIISENIK
jgi:cyclopropane fatty-acyl-phospholipid synthase-like methyltransferase